MRKRNFLLSCLLMTMMLASSYHASAQNGFSLSGQVLDEEKLPLAGVSVNLKRKSSGTSTDNSGKFRLAGARVGDTLVFSHIGYNTFEQAVSNGGSIQVVLTAMNTSMNQVVVVAYGTQKKITVTGALTTVKGTELAKSPTVNLGQSMVGRTPGIIAQQKSGVPGGDDVSIRIRGASTFAMNGEPLVLVDGVERPFTSINAEEVANVTILKDAATTAVYGIRGANGVILVTTKHGSSGKPSISFTTNVGIQKPTRLPKFVNAYDYAVLNNEAQRNDNPNATPMFSDEDLQQYKDGSDPLFHPDIDWVDFMMKKSTPQTKNTLAISGGGKLAKYFISLGYIHQDGLWKEFNKRYGYSNNTTYRRYNFRSNVDFNVTKSTVFSLSLGGYTDKNHTAGNPYYQIQNTPSGITPGLINDQIIINTNITARNPIPEISKGYDERFTNQFNVTADLNQKLDFVVKGLSFRSKLGYDSYYRTVLSRDVSRATFTPVFRNINGQDTLILQQLNDEFVSGVNSQTFNNRSKRVYLEAALQFDRSFGKHKVGALALYNQNKQYWPSNGSYTVQYPEVAIGYLGFVGRMTYNYDNRYLLEASVGRNGSENFPKGKRFGTFPAVSAGWNITNEPWMEKLLGPKTALSLLKVTASYGQTGNDKLIGENPATRGNVYYRFMYLPSVYEFQNNRVYFGEDMTGYQGVVEGQMGNPEITWEKAVKKNLALEVGLFDNRFSARADYFTDNRDNILYQKPAIAHVAAAIQDVYNIAKVENHGYEFELNWRDEIGDLRYSIGGNYTFARNKVIENGTPESPQNQLGNSLDQSYGLVALGFFNSQEEADKWMLQYASKSTPGDVKYRDVNGDGKVDQDDFVPIGFPTFPEINYGANLSLQYKNFDFSLLFQGAGNVSRVLSGFMQKPANQFGTIWDIVKEERWTPENAANAKRPKLTASYANSINYHNSTVWIRDASYLRLKNVEFGYNFSHSVLKKIGATSSRLYVSGQNLVTWDKLKVVDPEQEASNSLAYPQLQIFNIGLNVQF